MFRTPARSFLVLVAALALILGLASTAPASAATNVNTTTTAQVFRVEAAKIQVIVKGSPGTQVRFLVDDKRFGTTQYVDRNGLLVRSLYVGDGQYKVTVQARPAGSRWNTPWTTIEVDYETVWPSSVKDPYRWGMVQR